MKKKIMSIFMVIAITIFNFIPFVNVHAEERPVASITRDSKVYLVDIKKDGVSDLKYIYSGGRYGLTNSEEIFDGLREAFSGNFATLIPTEFTEGNVGIMGSTKYSSEMNANWSDYDYVINNYYTGEITDRVSDLYYNVNNTFKNNTDTENAELEESFDFLEDNIYNTTEKAEVFFPIGQHQQYVYRMVGGQLEKTLTQVIDYERVTIYYRSANVISETTPTTPTKINTLNIDITNPKVGDTATATTKPSVTIDSNAGYKLDFTQYLTKPETEGGVHFDGTFEENKDYWVEVSLEADESHTFASSDNMTLKVNGKTTDYTINNNPDGSRYFLFYAKVQATATTEENQETPPTTYEVIEGQNQTYTIGEDGATFRINADYSLFENGGKVYVDDALVSSDNYTSKSGSTIITFTKDYMSSLSEGEHTLKVAFNNGGSAGTTFNIANTPTTTTNKTINPQTGDNVMFYISMLGLSIIGLAGAGLYIRKRRFN